MARSLFEPDEEDCGTDEREDVGTESEVSNSSAQIESSWAFQILRRLEHSCWHVSNLTFGLNRLYGLKPGAVDEILTTP